jgi:hypothetical protein
MVGEQVTKEENARDQLAAFAVHVPRRTISDWGTWMRLPAPDLNDRVVRFERLMAAIINE